jgi:2-keto-4-pentenoate hydratase/2-oxohepta-3-ene-1,7-dioic acid hydratase in catechol pathway
VIALPVYKTDASYTLQPSKIIALGMNYREHVQEIKSVQINYVAAEEPREPILFAKTPNTLVGPERPVLIPSILSRYDFAPARTDYEAELAFIVKDECRNVPEAQAYEHIYGFTCANDISQRDIQRTDKSGWFRGKSFDTFCPVGPRIVLAGDIGDAGNLRIECRLNGKTVQSSTTGAMIFSIPVMFAFISRNFTLNAGDLVLTGTPSGVGPLKPGDVVEVEIEKIGVLRNPVQAE